MFSYRRRYDENFFSNFVYLFIYLFILLYSIVLILPHINMNPPRAYENFEVVLEHKGRNRKKTFQETKQ